MHLCQPLDLSVFGPMKRSKRSLLNKWHKESCLKSTLTKEHLLLLRCLLIDIKVENLISSFPGSGISPLNKDELLK